jgi:hypothetical protein
MRNHATRQRGACLCHDRTEASKSGASGSCGLKVSLGLRDGLGQRDLLAGLPQPCEVREVIRAEHVPVINFSPSGPVLSSRWPLIPNRYHKKPISHDLMHAFIMDFGRFNTLASIPYRSARFTPASTGWAPPHGSAVPPVGPTQTRLRSPCPAHLELSGLTELGPGESPD